MYVKENPSNMFKICFPFYSRFSSQHDCGHLCDHLTSMRIFILIMDKNSDELQKLRGNDYEHKLDLLIILHELCTFYPYKR